MVMKTFYRKNSFGIGRWCIWQDDHTICFGHSATLDGSMNIQSEEVNEGKAGRTIQEQIDLRMNSRISKMLDKGYKETADEAAKATTNQLGLVTPMLAKPLKQDRIGASIIQPKLNGHRCLITCLDGDIIAYSRQGKRIDTMSHITEQFAGILPEGAVLDGELYIHGKKLQSIASLVKRQQPGSADVLYYVYDYIDEEDMGIPYVERLWILINLLKSIGYVKHIILTESIPVDNLAQAMEIYSAHLAQGHEGSILRNNTGKYENGKRSSGLLKIKPLFDTEVEVIDIERSDTGMALCVCKLEGLDKTFKTLAPGSHAEKIQVLHNKEKYIGRRLKIEYRELTTDKIPFHAVGIEWFTTI